MYNEPVFLCGRFTGGAAGAQLVPVAGTTKSGLTVVHNGAANSGNYTVTIPTPVGTIQSYYADCRSPTADKNVRATPPLAGATSLNLLVTFHANGSAVDVLTTEELVIDVDLAASQYP